MKKLVIGTRGSALALWQAEHIKAELNRFYPEIEIELKIIKTTGDKILDTPLAKIGGKGLFTKEIEEAMLSNDIDIAVHSLKDVPITFPNGLVLSAITKREDARDAMLSERFASLGQLPKGAVVGTTSLRRIMQLLKYRDDLTIKQLRGNVNSRIKKLKNGEFDAIMLATAGIKRLKLYNEVKYFTPIDYEIMLPAMGQAALGIETRDSDEIKQIVSVLNDFNSYVCVSVERDFITALDGGCQVPIGVYCKKDENLLSVKAIIGTPKGDNLMVDFLSGDVSEYENLGKRLAQKMIDKGAIELLEIAQREGEEFLK